MDCSSSKTTGGGQWAVEEWCHWGKKGRKGRMNACKSRGPLAPHAGQTATSLRGRHSRAVRKLQHRLLDSRYVWSCHEPDVAVPGEGQHLYIFSAATRPTGNSSTLNGWWVWPVLWALFRGPEATKPLRNRPEKVILGALTESLANLQSLPTECRWQTREV